MSVVMLALLFVVIVVAIGAMAAMLVKNKPFYGAMGLCVLLGPAVILAMAYVAVA